MHHDDDIGAGGQRLAIAGLLVAAVAVVFVVDEDQQAKLLGELDRLVLAVVVDQDASIHQVGNLPHRRFQRHLGVVGRHHHGYAFSVDHGCSLEMPANMITRPATLAQARILRT